MVEELVSTIWGELRRHIAAQDRAEAAEVLVNILIDNDCRAHDIKEAFGSDRDVKAALAHFLDNQDEMEEEEPEDEENDWDD